jgi:hypothetical protein
LVRLARSDHQLAPGHSRHAPQGSIWPEQIDMPALISFMGRAMFAALALVFLGWPFVALVATADQSGATARAAATLKAAAMLPR